MLLKELVWRSALRGHNAGEVEIDASSGGGSPTNWAMIDLSDPDPFTSAASAHTFTPAELTITAQSGSDFSVALDPREGNPGGVIVSEGGGRFQCAVYLGSPANATLDVGSTKQRYLTFGATVGSVLPQPPPVNLVGWSLGLDLVVPIVPGADGGWDVVMCAASTIGYSEPGEVALAGVVMRGVGLVPGDSVIPLANSGMLALWQV